MRRVRVTKERLYSKEREGKSTGNHKRGDRTAEKHRENRKAMQRKVGNSSQLQTQLLGERQARFSHST
jgi:hypothetical protein